MLGAYLTSTVWHLKAQICSIVLSRVQSTGLGLPPPSLSRAILAEEGEEALLHFLCRPIPVPSTRSPLLHDLIIRILATGPLVQLHDARSLSQEFMYHKIQCCAI